MKIVSTILLLGFLFQGVFAQDNREKFRNKFDDVMEEDEAGNLTLRFFNALTGDPVDGASVTVDNEYELTSDAEGKVRFPVPDEDGFLQVQFECPKYISSIFKVEVIAGTLFFNRISVSPVLDLKKVRMVLDWDREPVDLDAHFMKKNGYHLSYHHTKVLSDGSGRLDRDDMDGYGPETITINNLDDLATYDFFVHDFTNRQNGSSRELSDSKATVKVYAEGRLLYVFQIPRGEPGNKWSVFRISEGQFIETNQLF
ncbi:MAG: YfaP family protein [Salinivirgaceae bacterium]